MGCRNTKKIWIQTQIGPVTVDSVEVSRYFAFWRHASFLIVPKNCFFWGASFKLIKKLAMLVPKKLQGLYEILLYHCYTLLFRISVGWSQSSDVRSHN